MGKDDNYLGDWDDMERIETGITWVDEFPSGSVGRTVADAATKQEQKPRPCCAGKDCDCGGGKNCECGSGGCEACRSRRETTYQGDDGKTYIQSQRDGHRTVYNEGVLERIRLERRERLDAIVKQRDLKHYDKRLENILKHINGDSEKCE